MKKFLNVIFVSLMILSFGADAKGSSGGGHSSGHSSFGGGGGGRSSTYSSYRSSTFSSPSKTSSNSGKSSYTYKPSTTKTSSYNSYPTQTTKVVSNTAPSTTSSKPDTSTFIGRIEQRIDNFEDRGSTYSATTKLTAPVNKVSTAPVSNSAQNKSLSKNKAYLTSGVAAGVVAGSLASDSKNTFASTSKQNVNNDNSAVVKPSVNSPPVNSLSVNKTYASLSNNTPIPKATLVPLAVNPNSTTTSSSYNNTYVRNNPQPIPYVVNNYNNSVDNSGRGLTNTLMNYALISSIMHHDKPTTVVNNYQQPQQYQVESNNVAQVKQPVPVQPTKPIKEQHSEWFGFVMVAGVFIIVGLFVCLLVL